MSNRRILHLAPDEKFINSANWQFEKVLPEQNDFIIIKSDDSTDLKFVELKENVSVKTWSRTLLRDVVSIILDYELVVLHGLSYYQSQIVLNAPKNVIFLWIIFGIEIYNNKLLENNFFGKLTKKSFEKDTITDILKNKLRRLFYRICKNTDDPDLSFVKAARLIKNIGILYEEEFNYLIRNKIIGHDSIYLKFTYYPIEFIFKGLEDLRVNGENILLGNSSSSTNNHLEAFELIRELQLKDKKVITPLSYGSKEYAKEISKKGEVALKGNFVPVLEFMSLDNYYRYLQQCGIVIMNHYRQQAVGNILAMIWMGAKVYLNERNSVYHYLKRIGIKVFSIKKELNPLNINVFKSLDDSVVDLNREILSKEIGKEVILIDLKNNLEKILK